MDEFMNQLGENIGWMTMRARGLWADNHDKADDLVMQTVEKAIEKQRQFNGDNLSGWLYVVMKNIFLDDVRKASAHKEVEFKDSIESSEQPDTPEDVFIEDAKMLEITNAINNLTPKLKAVMELWIDNESLKGISNTLNITLSTAKSRLCRGREKIKESL